MHTSNTRTTVVLLTGKQADFTKLFMAHPPMEERIARLRGVRSQVTA